MLRDIIYNYMVGEYIEAFLTRRSGLLNVAIFVYLRRKLSETKIDSPPKTGRNMLCPNITVVLLSPLCDIDEPHVYILST